MEHYYTGEILTDLHGHSYSVIDWSLELTYIPLFTIAPIFTKDILSDNLMIVVGENTIYIYLQWANLYMKVMVKYLGYEESKDIRKKYKHVNKSSKTNGSNRKDEILPCRGKSRVKK